MRKKDEEWPRGRVRVLFVLHAACCMGANIRDAMADLYTGHFEALRLSHN